MRKWIAFFLVLLVIASLLYIFSNSLKSDSTVSKTKGKVEEVVETVIEAVTHKEVSIDRYGKRVIAKMGHIAEFFVFSALFTFTYAFLGGSFDQNSFFRMMFVCAFAALTDEHLQLLDPSRSSRVSDVMIDLSACMVGYFTTKRFYSFMERRKFFGINIFNA